MITERILGIILQLLAPCPANPATARAPEIATETVEQSRKYDLDQELIAVWMFYESSFDQDRVGKLKEVGLFQVRGQHRRDCEAAGIDVLGVECGAFLIDKDRRYCGSLERGLNRYASGKCEGTPRSKRIVKFRLNEVRKWSAW